MSALNLSLYHLAEGGDLLELFEMRADAQRHVAELESIPANADVHAEAVRDIVVLDEQITLYMAALPTKVDKVRAVWRRIETLIDEAAAEVKFQSKRVQHLKADLERLKDYCQRSMELIEWPANRPRKLMGRSGYLLLKRNGGRPAVEVYDETLVPDDLCTVTVTTSVNAWIAMAQRCTIDPAGSEVVKVGPRVTSLSLISEALQKPCAVCGGDGNCERGHHPHKWDDCKECGGSGRQSVPGARLKPVGQHCEVK